MDVLTKIINTGERAMQELNKQQLTAWNATTTSVMKYIVDRLMLCFDELSFHLQTRGLNEESTVITKLCFHFGALFSKVEEINQRKQMNPPELPLEYCQRSFSTNATTKTIFGGAEVLNFSILAAQKQQYITADQEYRVSKPKFKKNMQNKATDTGDDAIRYLNAEYLGEKEKELQRAKEENDMNIREIEKFLKLKGLWSEVNPSNAPNKLQDLGKHLERELQKNEMYINNQIRIANQEEDFQLKDFKQEIKDKVVLGVQRQTADKIMKFAERKMKEEFEKMQLKKNAGLQLHKRKSVNMQRIDELEHLINTKNEEILEKEQKISNLYNKFQEQETKMVSLMVQMEQIKATEKLNSVRSDKLNEKQSHVEIQVNLADPKMFRLELQIKEVIEENQNMKAQLQELYDLAKNDKQKVLIQPQLIEEVLMMILQSELQAEGKIELLQTFLQYLVENSESDIAKLPPNELYKTVRQKLQYNTISNRNLEDVLEKFEEMQSDDAEFSSPGSIKKQKKPKQKQPKSKSNKIVLEKVESTIEPIQSQKSEQQISIKKTNKNKLDEYSQDESQFTQNNNESISNFSVNLTKKKINGLNQISEETSAVAKQTPKKTDRMSPQSGNRAVFNNNTSMFKPQSDIKEKEIKNNYSIQNQSTFQQQKEPSHFKTESQKQVSSGRQGTNRSKNQLETSNLIKEVKVTSSSQAQSQQTPTFVKKMMRSVKSRQTFKDENGDIDYEEIDDEVANRGVQVNLLISQFQEPPQKEAATNMGTSQVGFQTPKVRESYRQLEEKVTAKFTQTDDFFMWNLFQKMQVDLGLTEEQVRKLEQIFLNEQQFIHFYEKTPSQQQRSRGSRASTMIDQNTKGKQEKLMESAINDSKMTTMIQQKNETTDSDMARRPTISIMKTTQPQKGIDSPMNLVGRQKSQVLLSYTNESSMMQGNPQRSVSQTSDVHIVNYASVTPDKFPIKQKQTTSQKILDDMLKNKIGLTSPFDIETKEQKEQKLYFSVFGDELQTDADFELEAVRANMGKPLEVIQDHLKEDAMKKIYQQFMNRPKNPWQDQLYMIISQYANKTPQTITYIDFKKYYENYMRVHKRCGDGCIHIMRFLARVGFGIQSKRKALNMSKQSVSPFGQLPKLK